MVIKHRHITDKDWMGYRDKVSKLIDQYKAGEIKDCPLCVDDYDSLNMCMLTELIAGHNNKAGIQALVFTMVYLKAYEDATADAQDKINAVNDKLDEGKIH